MFRIEEVTGKGRGMIAAGPIASGAVIVSEPPLASAQFLWNAKCKYKACQFCLASMEPALDMARRLTEQPFLELPHLECDAVQTDKHVQCGACGEHYCSEECRDKAWSQFHHTLCTRGNPDHPLVHLADAWMEIHHPPETASIMLVARIFASIVQGNSKLELLLDHFCHDFTRASESGAVLNHKLLKPEFEWQINLMRETLQSFFTSPEVPNHDKLAKWLDPIGFRSMLALIGTNASGIGCSSVNAYEAKVSELNLCAEEKENVESILNGLYDVIQEVSGEFIACEGSGLFELQSACNHSCRPNAEVRFPHNSFCVEVVSLRDIDCNEEISISYIDHCILHRSKRFRSTYLRENYLFECSCEKCVEQTGHSDESEPDDDDDGDDGDEWEEDD